MNAHKNRAVSIRIKEEEYNWMASAAKIEDLSVSSFLRRIIVKKLSEGYPKPKPPIPNWLIELERQNRES
jgi:hypothetical protein